MNIHKNSGSIGWALFGSVIVLMSAVSASAGSTLFDLERDLEKRIETVAKTKDAQAIAVVRIQTKKKTEQLPLTPFTVKDLEVLDESGIPQVTGIEVSVHGKDPKAFETLRPLVELICSPFRVKPKISWTSIPEATREIASADSPPSEKGSTAPLSSFMEGLSNRSLFAGTLLLGSIFYLGFVLFNRKLSARSLEGSIASPLREIANAITQGGPGEVSTNSRPSDAASRPEASESEGSPAHSLGLTDDGLLALISDCYWCEYDGYAKWLWNQSEAAQRANILERWPLLREYAQSFSALPIRIESFHSDVAYVLPLPLENISMGDAGLLVQKHPILLGPLSTLRRKALGLPVDVFLRLETQSDRVGPQDLASALAALKTARASPSRPLKGHSRIQVRADDESSLLELYATHPSLPNRVPSLVWLSLIGTTGRAEIFERYSARDLAEAWAGPEDLLATWLGELPPKKSQLLSSYLLDSSVPDPVRRESDSFLRLWEDSVRALEPFKKAA